MNPYIPKIAVHIFLDRKPVIWSYSLHLPLRDGPRSRMLIVFWQKLEDN